MAITTTTGRSLFLSLLADEGVKHLFGNPGTTELAIIEALGRQSEIEYVLGLQESAVMAMADGYARASGGLAACNLHVAPGLGNAIGSLYNAKWVGSPVIVAAGQHAQGAGLMDPPLYDPLVPIAQPMVKWAVEAARAADLPRIIRRAAKIALTPPTGPVFISLPGDVLDAETDVDPGKSTRVETATRPADAALERLAERLLAAQSPVVLAGHELSTRDAWNEAASLAELIGAPVYQQTFAYSAQFPSRHPAFMGVMPMMQAKAREILGAHDLLVVLGADALRMSSVPSALDALPEGMPLVHVSERDWELGKNYATEIALRANVKDTLAALLPLLRARRDSSGAQRAERRLAELTRRNWTTARERLRETALAASQRQPIAPDYLMMRIAESLPENAVVVNEALVSSQSLLGFLAPRDPKSFFGVASGGIGFAVPGAVGISLASPGRPVMAVVGDGSAMYNIQALWTAANLALPITYVIANNRGYRSLKERMGRRWPGSDPIGMNITRPLLDFAAMAQSMGVPGRRISAAGELADALRDAQRETTAGGGPRLLEVIVDGGG